MKTILHITLFVMIILLGMIFMPERVVSYEAEPIKELTPWEYSANKVADRWGMGHLEEFYNIIQKESGWNYKAENPTSTARGLCQTMMSLYEDDLDGDFLDNPYKQIDWCLDYILNRYGNPKLAMKWHVKHNWF